MGRSSNTSLFSRAAGLLGLAAIVFGLVTAPAQIARAQVCNHVGNDVNCPFSEMPGSSSVFFNAQGEAVWPLGTITPGDYNVPYANTETGQGFFNLTTELDLFPPVCATCAFDALESAYAEATKPNRWGDYSALNVDPANETYWFSEFPTPSARSYYIGTTHTVKAGETLFRIALRYGVTEIAIRTTNDISAGATPSPGQTLRIPGKPGSAGGTTNNTDCGATNSCGNDAFKPPPINFGDCSGGGCDQTGTTDPELDDPQFGVLAEIDRILWDEVTIPIPGAPRNVSTLPVDPTAPVPVSITVDVRFSQKEGAFVLVLNPKDNKTVASGTTVRQGQGRPKFKVALAPGTYNIMTSWKDDDGNVFSGQQTYTVTGGENRPNVGVKQGGYQNPPAQGTNPKPIVGAAVGVADLKNMPIFSDGFESGDTSSWSSAVP